jgi:3',5'-cyclic AMP phosphodiesterase CpdA
MQTTTASRIAHLSDVHMLDPRPSRSRAGFSMRVRFLSIGRPLDAQERRRKLVRALEAAKRSGAGHFVISGDLTEIGAPEEFEAFAETLHDSKIDPDRVTLVPGNHDAYTSKEAWKSALEGPLAAFRAGASDEPGKIVERGDLCFVPLDVTRMQPVTRSAGELTPTAADVLEQRLDDPYFRNRTVVLVQHHPPFSHKTGAWQWIDGLMGGARLMALLSRLPNLYALHGHLHYVVDKIVELGKTRIFGAPAIVDDENTMPRVRLYDVIGGRLESAGLIGC